MLLLSLVIAGSAHSQSDSGIVKIRVDVDSVKIIFDDSLIAPDQDGNILLKDVWLIFNTTAGEHSIALMRAPYETIDTTIIVSASDVISLDIKFIPEKYNIYEPSEDKMKLAITSVPDSCSIMVNNEVLNVFSPAVIYLKDSSNIIKLSRDGYLPLASNISVNIEHELIAHFRLKTAEPEPLTADSLGLFYIPQKELRNILEAERVKRKYQSMTEIFAVMPLSQGIMAKLVVNDDQEKEANLLIGVGTVLTLGTYVLSKVLYKKRFNEIIVENEIIMNENIFAEEQNREIDVMVMDKNQELLRKWRNDNVNNGRVEIQTIIK